MIVPAAVGISLLCVLVVVAIVWHDRAWARALAREIRSLPETAERLRQRR